MKIIPLADHVVLRVTEAEEVTKGGIILTAKAQGKPVTAEVVCVGPGGMVDGSEVVMAVKPGDKVITAKYAGSPIKINDEEYTIVRQNEILAIVETE